MSEAGCWVGPLTWDALVKLFVKAGEVEKADSMLQKAAAQKRNRPLYGSYITLLDKYAEMGDVHNAEKIFHRLRQEKYRRNVNQYQLLAKAYKNAGTPAYGLRERMKADNVFPGKIFLKSLQHTLSYEASLASMQLQWICGHCCRKQLNVHLSTSPCEELISLLKSRC
ncbi:hypothetical protein HPP92_017782 [Vanilla planifolia]|uniref:Pentatricopeptide repeat-containing protein n=1 Tax=Vanilla planifolia TaxID=51239 RepID=A0A835Q9X0_VANPL|nr:hypothetical protein HPP92_017782 [Vanilla planifolia]